MTGKGTATFDDLVALAQPAMRPIVMALRELVFEIHPQTCEVVRLGDRAATFGVGPKKMSEGYVYIMPQAKWVNLGFYKGADLDDPTGLLEGTGAKMRHIKIRSVDEVQRPEARNLIVAALDERTNAVDR